MKTKYPVVDDADHIIGYKEKDQAYREHATLRSVQIFVYDSQGKLYIQKRGKGKARFPNYLCASVAGHVEPGENYQEAATRELKEELGITHAENLKFIAKEKVPVGEDDYAMMSLFSLKTREPITLQKEEIDSGNFYTIGDVKKMIYEKKPFTPSFLHHFNTYPVECSH